MKKELLIDLIITIAASLFLYASFSKYADMAQFGIAMHKQPFPEWLINLIIWGLPPVEIAIAIVLLVSIFFEILRTIGLYAFGLMMAVFTVYIIAILLHVFPRVPCSCGGVIQSLRWNQHLVFNLLFLGAAWVGLYLQRRKLVH